MAPARCGPRSPTANTDADDSEIVLAAGATYVLDICPGTDEDANVDGDLDHTAVGPRP